MPKIGGATVDAGRPRRLQRRHVKSAYAQADISAYYGPRLCRVSIKRAAKGHCRLGMLDQAELSRPPLDLFWQVLDLANRNEIFGLLNAGKADIPQDQIFQPTLRFDRVFTGDQSVQRGLSVLCDLRHSALVCHLIARIGRTYGPAEKFR